MDFSENSKAEKMTDYLRAWLYDLSNRGFAQIPMSLGTNVSYSTSPLTDGCQRFLMLTDRSVTSRASVNVYGEDGSKIYSLEAKNHRAAKWYVYAEPERVQIAAIDIGLLHRAVTSKTSGVTHLRSSTGIRGKLHREFHDNLGNLYSWNRRSNYLERIQNPHGEQEEHRRRIGLVRRLRNARFDWEVFIDSQAIEPILGLATAFIMAKTQWSTQGAAQDQSFGLSHQKEKEINIPVNVASSSLLVYQKPEQQTKPRNFFNPPTSEYGRY